MFGKIVFGGMLMILFAASACSPGTVPPLATQVPAAATNVATAISPALTQVAPVIATQVPAIQTAIAPVVPGVQTAIAPAQAPTSISTEPAAQSTAIATTPVQTPAAAPTGQVGAAVMVELTEFQIRIPTTMKAGKVVFHVTNAGTTRHSFEIEGGGMDEELDDELDPGETGILEIDLKPGSYEVYCPVDGHKAQGMRVQITVSQ